MQLLHGEDTLAASLISWRQCAINVCKESILCSHVDVPRPEEPTWVVGGVEVRDGGGAGKASLVAGEADGLTLAPWDAWLSLHAGEEAVLRLATAMGGMEVEGGRLRKVPVHNSSTGCSAAGLLLAMLL